MEIKEVTIPGSMWTHKLADHELYVSSSMADRCTQFLNIWAQAFPKEDTFVQREYGVPSLIVRLDCAPNEQGGIGLFEVEERPAGVGLTLAENNSFRRRLELVQSNWPHFDVVMSATRQKGGDDHLWRQVITRQQVNGHHVLVRAEPEEAEFSSLARMSVSTVAYKGDKSYGEKMGLWQRVTAGAVLPRDDGFALKPIQGSKCRGVHIVPPKGYRVSGGSTITAATRELETRREMYVQPWIPPIQLDVNGVIYNAIWRLFYGYDVRERRWIALGGMWNARRGTLRIHGATDTIFGRLVVEEATTN